MTTKQSPTVESVRFVKGDQFFDVTHHFERDGKHIAASCPELGIGSFGDDRQEAESALIEAIVLQIEAQEQAGELKKFLKRNDIKLRTTRRPHWTPVKTQLVSI